MSLPYVLCSPASSGLSLALARQFLKATKLPLIATARGDLGDAKDRLLDGIEASERSRVTMLDVDFTKDSTMKTASDAIGDILGKANHLRMVSITPGVLISPEKTPQQIDHEMAMKTFEINTVGPMLALKHFSQYLPKRGSKLEDFDGVPAGIAVWATMSARVGSISDNRLGGWYGDGAIWSEGGDGSDWRGSVEHRS